MNGLSESVFSVKAFVVCIVLGAVGTGAAYMASATLSGRVGSTRSSTLVYAATPVSVLLGVLVRNESLAIISAIGAVIPLSGAWIASRADDGA
ncbi:MAG: drug/metabolite transporter (DMT)-like permease [Candidatus Poriferisodalaceae bacterium]|jgi:drug/metabolite transporter (DMT)-like permease